MGAPDWFVTDNFGEGKRLHMVWGDGVLIARTCSEPNSKQHARLFAAAPELLAALHEASKTITALLGNGATKDEWWATMPTGQHIKAAIAKAEP
jgi:hypothetical protein